MIALAGENVEPLTQPGFPFVRTNDGKPALPVRMGAGKFGVPHSVAIDDEEASTSRKSCSGPVSRS